MMNKYSKFIFIAGVLVLLLLFKAPIWRITLEAPQYPQGVTMYIYINKIGGKTNGTLQNINILNHYVGMKKIDPGAIPELKYFPKIILAMTLLGVVAGFVNNKKVWMLWIVLFIVLCALGIYDFYLWEYDYGHNLDPEAPIQIQGMSYQPPLIGSKMLLNFNALSYPHTGSVFIGLSFLLTIIAWYLKVKNYVEKKPA
jgi:copper chaperone NosL